MGANVVAIPQDDEYPCEHETRPANETMVALKDTGKQISIERMRSS
jgi:hypothetical protein